MSNRRSGNEPEHSDSRPAVTAIQLQFGNFTLDLQKHALFRGAERVHLTLKPLQVLEIQRMSCSTSAGSESARTRAAWRSACC